MRKRLAALAAICLGIFIVFPATVHATGFRLPEQSASAMGMASAFVGQADDASAVWYNPAGMTQLSGTQVMGGLIAIYPAITHENNTVNPGTIDVSKREIHLPIHLYATYNTNDQLSFGIGVNNPFGLATDWDKTNSAAKYVATYSKVVTTEINPNFAYKVNGNLSVAAGIAYVKLRATLEKTTNLGLGTDTNFRLSGDGDGWGVNAAVLYKISDSIGAGLSYRSRVKVDIDGNAELSGGASASASTSITLPDLIQAGVSYKTSESLTLNADIDVTMWSTYDRIVVESTLPLFNATDEKDWKDVWCLRLGGQYQLSDQWKVKAGYLYDKNPVKEERFETRIPDSDRQGISIGVGYAKGNISVDAAYLYLRFNNRTISNSLADNDANLLTPDDSLNGTYKSQAHLAGITVGYKF